MRGKIHRKMMYAPSFKHNLAATSCDSSVPRHQTLQQIE